MTLIFRQNMEKYEPRHAKICLLNFRAGPTQSESESARYSTHLKKSITWSVYGNGQKKKKYTEIYNYFFF